VSITGFNEIIFHNPAIYGGSDVDDEVRSARAMWRAVITQALMDAASNSRKACSISERLKARVWLKGNSEDFITVCTFADMDPEYVKMQAKNALARNCIWRKSGMDMPF
jgi:hypothetical protein